MIYMIEFATITSYFLILRDVDIKYVGIILLQSSFCGEKKTTKNLHILR